VKQNCIKSKTEVYQIRANCINPKRKLYYIAIYGRVFPLHYKIITKIKENRLRKPKN
jgi:hypothetical protein